ncbi:uncharacterized protein FIBRA_08828 [Fibroporia radiculosa]|uniref:Uncharacterized protein n=1 Tax=Fibroporia radiculosa TaxID=599839 RepID=J4GIB9_9APHY|nr:uncharacterized protein FIBRA_08828 [Fibroporia radiculosa]CCM06553.1 predicted protein [Fibroporia radiculosa]
MHSDLDDIASPRATPRTATDARSQHHEAPNEIRRGSAFVVALGQLQLRHRLAHPRPRIRLCELIKSPLVALPRSVSAPATPPPPPRPASAFLPRPTLVIRLLINRPLRQVFPSRPTYPCEPGYAYIVSACMASERSSYISLDLDFLPLFLDAALRLARRISDMHTVERAPMQLSRSQAPGAVCFRPSTLLHLSISASTWDSPADFYPPLPPWRILWAPPHDRWGSGGPFLNDLLGPDGAP